MPKRRNRRVVELTLAELRDVVEWGEAVQSEWGYFTPEDDGEQFWLWHRLAKLIGWTKKRRLYEAWRAAEKKRLSKILREKGL